MSRRFFFLITALMCIIYFTSGKPSEIADRIMIHAVGIDFSSGQYKVTMQVFTPEASGSETAVDPSKPNVTLATGVGASVNEAMRNGFEKLGGNVFIGQNQILLFGKSIDFTDRENLFGYFVSSSEAFRNVDCAAAENTAEEILSMPIQGGAVTSEKYPQMIEAAAENGRCARVMFTQLINSVNSDAQAVILPVFSIDKGESEEDESAAPQSDSQGGESELQQQTLKISNGAVFVGGKYTADITFEQMGLAAMINGTGDYVRTDVDYKGRQMSKTFKIASREVRSDIADGKIEFTVVCRLAAKDTQMFENLSDRDSSSARAARLIEEKSQTLANALCTKFSPELLGADCLLKRFYPQIYRKYSENLDALYERVSFKIVIKE